MNFYSDLSVWGWNLFFSQQIDISEAGTVARVIGQERDLYRLSSPQDTVLWARLSGRFRHEAEGMEGAFPAVGDWVVCRYEPQQDKALIERVLTRQSCFYRKDPQQGLQVVAANMDTVFIVTSLNRDLNERRLDRYISMVWDSGAQPVLVLTKKDLCANSDERVSEMQALYAGVPVHAVSVLEPESCVALREYLQPGKTVVLLGSSGVGKSTLTNFFLGDFEAKTQAIRDDNDRGRHTTTSRSLYLLPEGALLMDTPGMRQLALVDQEEGLEELFSDILELTSQCRFSDCSHGNEPGCAVQKALEEESLAVERWASYCKLQKEVAYLERREDPRLQAEERRKWKKRSQDLRVRLVRKGRGEI